MRRASARRPSAGPVYGNRRLTVLLRRAVGPRGQVVGVDFSLPMLQSGVRKFQQAQARFAQGDAVRLPLASGVFDAVTVAFGIRNVAEIDQAFVEIARVLKPGGRWCAWSSPLRIPDCFKNFTPCIRVM